MPTIYTLFYQVMYRHSFLSSVSVWNSTNFLGNKVIEISIDLSEQYFIELSVVQKNQERQTFCSPHTNKRTYPQAYDGPDHSTRDLIIRGGLPKNHLHIDFSFNFLLRLCGGALFSLRIHDFNSLLKDFMRYKAKQTKQRMWKPSYNEFMLKFYLYCFLLKQNIFSLMCN